MLLKYSRPLIRQARAFSTVRSTLLQASFIQAKHHGFTDDAIVAACRDLDLPSVSGALLQQGPYDIVQFAMDEWLRQLQEELRLYKGARDEVEVPYQELGTTEKVRVGVKTRLLLMSPYIEKWPQAMALGLKPRNLPTTVY